MGEDWGGMGKIHESSPGREDGGIFHFCQCPNEHLSMPNR